MLSVTVTSMAQPSSRDLGTFVHKPKMPDLLKASGKHLLQELSNEFLSRDYHRSITGLAALQGCDMWSTVTAFWLFLFGSIGAIERAHVARLAEAANKIQVGATEDEVIRTLGKPLAIYQRSDGWSILGIGAHPPQWLYGTTININRLIIADIFVMANPLPLNIRLFSYDDDDLVVDWDTKRRVSRIAIPNIPIDHRADKMLDTIYEWHRIYLAISSGNR